MLVAAMTLPTGTVKFRDLQRRFDRAAAHFDSADFVHRKTADGIFDRLDPMLIDARRILDLGCATGSASRQLCRRFKRSRVYLLDASFGMLRKAAGKQTWFSRVSALQGNATTLPLRTGCIDLVFANLLLPCIDNARAVFAEVARVLRQGGLFVFSTLGPDSLAELRDAWADVDDDQHVIRFADMHDVGDGLVHSGLRDPVLDTDFLNVSYRDTASLFRDLTLVGARNWLAGRPGSLTGKIRFRNMQRRLEHRFRDGLLQLRLELVYGHAWGAGPRQPAGEFHVDAARIPKRRG